MYIIGYTIVMQLYILLICEQYANICNESSTTPCRWWANLSH